MLQIAGGIRLAECITGGAVILTERLIGPAGDVAFTVSFTGTIAIPVAFEPGGGRGIGLAGAAGITATPSIVARIVDDRGSANVNLANIHAVARTSPTHLFEQIKMGALRIAPGSLVNRMTLMAAGLRYESVGSSDSSIARSSLP